MIQELAKRLHTAIATTGHEPDRFVLSEREARRLALALADMRYEQPVSAEEVFRMLKQGGCRLFGTPVDVMRD